MVVGGSNQYYQINVDADDVLAVDPNVFSNRLAV